VLATRYLAEISTPRAADKSAQAQSQLARVMPAARRSRHAQDRQARPRRPPKRVLDLAG
jgi:hypothetical protein